MIRRAVYKFVGNRRKKRPGQHSKNASKGQVGWKKKYNRQGK